MHIEHFIKYLKNEKRYSEHTIRSYQRDLMQFIAFAENENKLLNPLSIDYKIIRKWIVFLMNNGYSAKSINRKLSTLRSFYKYLLKEGIVKTNPTIKITAPKVEKRLPQFIEIKSMNMLFDNIEFPNSFEGLRDELILLTFYFTGIRRAELINIKIENIDIAQLTIKVLGKRNKERIIPVPKMYFTKLAKYQQERSKIRLCSDDNSYLFITIKGCKMYPKSIYRVVNKYLTKVTTNEKKSPHILRHTFATHMLNNGADLNAIKELLGHANLSATEVYTHNTFEKLKNIYNQAHPRA